MTWHELYRFTIRVWLPMSVAAAALVRLVVR